MGDEADNQLIADLRAEVERLTAAAAALEAERDAERGRAQAEHERYLAERRATAAQGRHVSGLLSDREMLSAARDSLRAQLDTAAAEAGVTLGAAMERIQALRTALISACAGWEVLWTSERSEPVPDEIAELRQVAER